MTFTVCLNVSSKTKNDNTNQQGEEMRGPGLT